MQALDDFILGIIDELVEPAVMLLGALAFVYFVFGVVMYIRNADNEEKRTEGQRHILWAIIGLAIIFGANAIVGFIGDTVNSVAP